MFPHNHIHHSFSSVHMKSFLSLVAGDKYIQHFLYSDHCYKLADKYLLAMVFVYFIRSGLPVTEYNRKNFFAALYMAHEMEEDVSERKFLIAWAFVEEKDNKKAIKMLKNARFELWKAMDFRAWVTRECCEAVMQCMKDSPLWLRERSEAHGGAHRRNAPKPRCSRCSPVAGPSTSR